jgi:molybdopterin-guanine dinucleotide biosynthesis protein A
MSLAGRTAALLTRATFPVLEVGPGHTGLTAVIEEPPGAGPLVAIAAGWRRLEALGWTGPAVVVATDLPRLTNALLVWLATHPSSRSVVPVAGGVPQPLCARYAARDLGLACELTDRGSRAMRDLLGGIDALLAGPELWGPAAGDTEALSDADTPADLARLRMGPA